MNTLKKTWVLWSLFLATLVIFTAFRFWIPQLGGSILDSVATIDEVQAVLGGMSAAQKHSHFMMTAVLDMIFPFAYGGLFAGLALRFGGNLGIWLAVPALIVIPVDLAENTVQLLALTGDESLLPVKAILTPVKFTLFPLAGILALGALAIGTARLINTRK